MIDPIGNSGKYTPDSMQETAYLPHPSEFILPNSLERKNHPNKTTLPRFEILDQAEELSRTPQTAACATVEVLLLGSSLSLPPLTEDTSKLHEAQMMLTQQVVCCLADSLTREVT